MIGGMTAVTEGAVTRPAGTRAALYAVLSLVVSPVLWVAGLLAARAGDKTGALTVAFFVAALSVLVAAVVAVIRRLASDRRETINLPRTAAWAVGAPLASAALWAVLVALFA